MWIQTYYFVDGLEKGKQKEKRHPQQANDNAIDKYEVGLDTYIVVDDTNDDDSR